MALVPGRPGQLSRSSAVRSTADIPTRSSIRQRRLSRRGAVLRRHPRPVRGRHQVVACGRIGPPPAALDTPLTDATTTSPESRELTHVPVSPRSRASATQDRFRHGRRILGVIEWVSRRAMPRRCMSDRYVSSSSLRGHRGRQLSSWSWSDEVDADSPTACRGRTSTTLRLQLHATAFRLDRVGASVRQRSTPPAPMGSTPDEAADPATQERSNRRATGRRSRAERRAASGDSMRAWTLLRCVRRPGSRSRSGSGVDRIDPVVSNRARSPARRRSRSAAPWRQAAQRLTRTPKGSTRRGRCAW